MRISRNVMLLFSFLTVFSIVLPAYGDSGEITAVTNKVYYLQGEPVIIHGTVTHVVDDNPVDIIIRSPMGNVYDVDQVNILNNNFVHNFVINDNSIGGTYTVIIKYDTETMPLKFIVNASALTIVNVMDSQIKVRTNGTNMIKYGDVSISQSGNEITIPIDTSQVTTDGVYEQYQIPKMVIDSPGGEIVLKADGNQIPCTQSETDVFRILDCQIPSGSKEIELFGVNVIPEFGPLVGLTILFSVSIVIIFSGSRKLHF